MEREWRSHEKAHERDPRQVLQGCVEARELDSAVIEGTSFDFLLKH